MLTIYKVFVGSFLLFLTFSCQNSEKKTPSVNGAFAKAKHAEGVNLMRITESGELIVATISGPDTYYEYRGVPMGMQYALAENFAAELGVSVRVETVSDTATLAKKLKNGDVDLICLQMSEKAINKAGLTAAGPNIKSSRTSWAVLNSAKDLAEALNDWYSEDLLKQLTQKEDNLNKNRNLVKRTVRAPFISKEKGIISTYDTYFKEAATATGWDWRLIAAQCYQESGFDPNAVSWAGAKGLMQIMPRTADMLNLPSEKIFQPRDNIAAASRLIYRLQNELRDVSDPVERIKFVLASYNGGLGHITDARALTRKYGGNSQRWEDVEYYIRGLSSPRYYRDPIVRHGYMIGSETSAYVTSIIERWRQYGGDVARPFINGGGRIAGEKERTVHKKNKYSQERKILSPEELKSPTNN